MTKNLRIPTTHQPRQDETRAVHATAIDAELRLPAAETCRAHLARMERTRAILLGLGRTREAKRMEKSIASGVRLMALIGMEV